MITGDNFLIERAKLLYYCLFEGNLDVADKSFFLMLLQRNQLDIHMIPPKIKSPVIA